MTDCVRPYIFYGRPLSPEQVQKLRELNIESEDEDLS